MNTTHPLRRRVLGLAAVAGFAALSATALPAAAEPKRIAIANFGEHPQLNAVAAGFKKALADAGFAEGKDVVYSLSHTNFDASLVPQMIAKLQAEKPVLMLTITTPVSQIAKKALATSGIPIIFAAVTDPVAAKLVPSWTAGDTGMSGASDLQDVAAVVSFSRQLLPNMKGFGLPYNPGEANDVALVEKARAAVQAAGLTLATVGVDSANDIPQRIASLKGKADMVYNPASNLLQPAVAAVAAGARTIGIPVINSDESAVEKGIVLASFAVNYTQVGMNAGRIAAQILKGTDPKTIPVAVPTLKDHAPKISRKGLEAFKLKLPPALADCKCLVD
ncbi:MAG: ABC transporter substrate-binding protein [Proteobacteria bacterium]|nr:ABC transporter substrate-binding protein [Pseudomonadota bacterium]